MRTRRLISFLLGAWLAAGALLVFVENENLRSVERLLENTRNPAIKQLNSLGQMEAQNSIRWVISEMNRSHTETFEWMQLAALVLIAGLLLMSPHGGKWSALLACVLAVLAIAQRFVLTPEVDRLSRQIDLVPVNVIAFERSRYFAFQSAAGITRLAMWLLGIGLALRMMAGSTLRHLLQRDLDSPDPEDGSAPLRPTRRGR